MFGIPLIEWVGYAASIMIAISLLMTNISVINKDIAIIIDD